MRSKLTVSLILLCSALIVSEPGFSKDANPGDSSFPLKKIKTQGFETYQGVEDWVAINNNSVVVFARDGLQDPRRYRLRSYTLKMNGKASVANMIIGGKGSIDCAAAVWPHNSGVNPSKKMTGLVFIFYSNQIEVTRGAMNIIAVAKFDSKGKLVGQVKELLRIQEHENAYFYHPRMFAAVRNNRVCLVFSSSHNINNDDYSGPHYAESYFLETDLNGNVIGDITQLNLPKSGDNQTFNVYKPFWTGSRWLIPVCYTAYKREENPPYKDRLQPQYNQIMMVVVNKKHTVKINNILKEKKVKEPTWRGYHQLSFVQPASSAPSAANSYSLFVHHRQTLTNDNYQKYDWFSNDYFLIKINKSTGKKAGKPKEVEIPKWKHTHEYDPEKTFSWATNKISPLVTLNNGKVVFTQTLTYQRYFYSSGNYTKETEHKTKLFSLNPASGKVTLLNQSQTHNQDGTYNAPHILHLGRKVGILNNMYYHGGVYRDEDYFSVLVP